MAEKFIIEGAKKLEGEIEVRGSKNAAGAIISAALMSNDASVIDNVPLVSDILNLLNILQEMGAEVEWVGERTVKITAGEAVDPQKINFEKFSKTRVSVLLIGALLSRFREFKISRPGGDRIGLRPITSHLQTLQELGAQIEETDGHYIFKRDKLEGKEIILPEFSVTATENLMMAAALAEGQTTIKIAAQEPQVQDLGEFLSKMGADIEGIGSHTIRVKGGKRLRGAEHKIIPDSVEAGTFLVIGAAVGKKMRVKHIVKEHLDFFLKKLEEAGVDFKLGNDFVDVQSGKGLKAVRVQALPHPGFPTDLLPLIVPLLTQAEGKSLIHDPLYENRLNYTQELRKMGADIEIVDPHRAFVFGKTPLQANVIQSWDIRAGASLVVAGLLAQGKTTIENIEQIDRGYEGIEQRLQQLGADIKRVNS